MVLDTLRQDCSSKLSNLRDLGFVEYDNAFASSSWTLPSHISMFTGLSAYLHRVHEGNGIYISNISKLSSEKLNRPTELTRLFNNLGYHTYCLTSNPMISPLFGFPFSYYRCFDFWGDATTRSEYLLVNKSRIGKALMLLQERRIGLLLRKFYYDQAARNVMRILGRPPLEKGSKYILKEQDP
ncbi:MAG: hypothetical protein JRN67_05340 [Nitrososphaerota archaeon]|nr:hypothetical protein [Nitrososphaerota archaeon]